MTKPSAGLQVQQLSELHIFRSYIDVKAWARDFIRENPEYEFNAARSVLRADNKPQILLRVWEVPGDEYNCAGYRVAKVEYHCKVSDRARGFLGAHVR